MRKVILVVFVIFLVSGCKKSIEKMKENAVISAMTDGQWAITSFVKNGSVITSDFSGYKFQYYSDKTVDAIKNGTVEKKGTWDGDAGTMTISANFLNTVLPLSLINGSWHIDNNSWTFVVASQNSGTETRIMRLEKL
jgi:PBP1b-binding outer membrane lipoprotein LpoB